MLLSAPSHIACTPYVDEEHWRRDLNDKLYESGHSGPAWTHLQIRKSELLDRWDRIRANNSDFGFEDGSMPGRMCSTFS